MADNIFTPEQQQQLAELMNGLYGITRETDPLIRANIEASKAADNAKKALAQLGKQLGNTAIDYSKTVMSAGEGFGKFGGVVTGATTAIGDWASKLGVAGAVVGGFIKIFGEIASKSLKQNDDLMKSYQNLSDMGSVAAGGFVTLRDQLHSVGLIAEEAEKFERVLKPITGELAKFGGSVSQGREQLTGVISGLIGLDNDMEKYLARLGYSTQDIREGAADFVQKQARLGLAQGKSQEQLTKESFKYMATLKELQELTGMSRDEAQKSLDMQLADARMNIYLGELTAQGREDEAKNLQLYLASFEKTFGKELTSGLKEIIYNEGKVVGQLSSQAWQATRGQVYKDTMTASREGVPVFLKMLKSTGGAIDANVKQFRNSLMVSGEEIKDVTGGFEAINGSIAIRNQSEEEYQKQLKEMIETGKNGTKRVNQNIDNEQKMRAMRIAGDKAIYEVGDMTVGLFTKLNEVMFGFGKTVAKVTDFLSGIIGKKTNYAASFRDAEDNAKDLEAARKSRFQLLQEIEATKQKIAEAEKSKVDYAKQIRDKQEEIKQLNQAYRNEKDVDKKKELYTKEAEEKRKLIELENMARQAGKTKDGGIDQQVALEIRRKKLIELQERLANEEKKVLELEKEKQKLAPGAGAGAADSDIVKKLKESGIVDPKAQANILAQIKAESGGNPQTESLKYSPEKLMKTFPSKFTDIEEAKAVAAKGEEAIGNKIYGGRMGNAADEGFKYRGRGLIQLTGKDNYAKFGKLLGLDLVNNPDLANDPDIAQRIAVAYFKEKQKAGVNLSDSKQVSKAVGHVDIDGKESDKRAELAQSILENLPKAATGGMFAGSTSGYPVMLHGDESVWPNQDLQEMLRQVQQTSLSQYKDELMGALGLKSKNLDLANENIMQSMPDMKGIVDALKQELPKLTQTSAPTTSTADNIVAEVMSVLSEKLDALIEEHRKTNDIQDQILTYTKA